MTVISSISEPALLGKLTVEIFLSPVVQVELLLLKEISVTRKPSPRKVHLSKMSFELGNLEVVVDPLVKFPRAEQRDLLGDSRGDLGGVGGLDQLRVEQLCLNFFVHFRLAVVIIFTGVFVHFRNFVIFNELFFATEPNWTNSSYICVK